MNEILARHPKAAELHRLILRLDLVSHVSAVSLNPSARASDVDIGGNRPPGGVDRFGDYQVDFQQRSADYFRRQWARCETLRRLEALLKEAKDALVAWQRTPLVAGVRPAMADPRWKQWVAECEHSVAELVKWYGCSRQYIHQVRKAYLEGGVVPSESSVRGVK